MLAKIKPVSLVFGLMLVFLCGCATLSDLTKDKKVLAYNTLSMMASVYDTSMKTVAILHSQELITDEELKEVMKVALVFWVAWHETYHAVEIWWTVDDAPSEQKALVLLEQLKEKFTTMMDILNPLLNRGAK